jgi:hypothetical protein
MKTVAEAYGGKLDRLLNHDAVAMPSGAYVVQLATKTLAAVRPANRQFVLQWLREIESTSASPPSEYLLKAAGYSDNAGSDIIMAVDLDGAFSPSRLEEYLKAKSWLAKQGADPASVASLLYLAKGMRVGVRFGEQASTRVAIDFPNDTSFMQPIAKQLLVEILEDAGMKIDDLDSWKAEAKGKEISLTGYLSPEGLRALLSVLPSPAPSVAVAKEDASESPKVLDPATATKQHFQAVTKLLKDLKVQKSETKTFGQYHVWFDRYAGKIEQLPILGVDKQVVDYSAFVAQQLRHGSQSVKTAGIRTGVRQAPVASNTDVYNYGYASGYWGGYVGWAVENPRAELQYEQAQKRVIKKEERGEAYMTMEDIRQSIIAATNGVRRAMTEKYQIEF